MQYIARRVDHHTCGLGNGEPAHARPQCWHRNTRHTQGGCLPQAVDGSLTDKVGVRHQILPHCRCVNDIPRLEQPAPGHDGCADGNWPLADGLIFDDLAALAFDRTRDTGPHPQMIIGRIDDGVNSASGDVPLHHFKGGRAYAPDHQRLLLGSNSCRKCRFTCELFECLHNRGKLLFRAVQYA